MQERKRSLPSEQSDRILCGYVNATNLVQVIRIANIPHWHLERVNFPGQRFLFEALPEALLEVHCGMMISSILSEKIPCNHLRINDT